MKVLAFDVATTTGVAWGTAGGTPQFATFDLGQKLPHVERFAKVMEVVHDMIETHAPDVAVFEEKVGGKHMALPGQLLACAMGAAHTMGVRTETMAVATIRKAFIGKHLTPERDFPGMSKEQGRSEIKRIVMNGCKMRGWDVSNFDEADAGALFEAWCAHNRHAQASPIKHGGLFHA